MVFLLFSFGFIGKLFATPRYDGYTEVHLEKLYKMGQMQKRKQDDSRVFDGDFTVILWWLYGDFMVILWRFNGD